MYDYDLEEYRNATSPVVHDHTGGAVYAPRGYPPPRPGTMQPIQAGQAYPPSPYGPPYGATPVQGGWIQGPGGYPGYPRAQFAPSAGMGMGMWGSPASGYGYPPLYQKYQQAKMLKTIGVVVDVLGQAIAAIMPVPTAPPITGASPADDENMKRYQVALANHAKTDERIRTVAKVVREALNTVKQL